MNILITGGAGFIGTHLVRRALLEGDSVTVLDNFSEQIHANNRAWRTEFETQIHNKYLKVIDGDVRDKTILADALDNQDVVVHFAAETGTGQSMYAVERYSDINVTGTATLMEYLVNNRSHHIQKVIVASSRAIYGEGKYECDRCGVVYPTMRLAEHMAVGDFEPKCPICGASCRSLATDETSAIHPSSFYGITKQVQEQMTLLFARTLGISAFALRYQNVYGPGQSLQNPYTGILAIFSNQARANKPIYIFEDGQESRDFVYIDDAIEATWRCIALSTPLPIQAALNVGSGQRITVQQVVKHITEYFGSSSEVSLTGQFREGDIRHNVADLQLASQTIQYKPQWAFAEGIRMFLAWASEQSVSANRYETSLIEMKNLNLLKG